MLGGHAETRHLELREQAIFVRRSRIVVEFAPSRTASGLNVTRLNVRRGRPPGRKETSSVDAKQGKTIEIARWLS